MLTERQQNVATKVAKDLNLDKVYSVELLLCDEVGRQVRWVILLKNLKKVNYPLLEMELMMLQF